LIAGALSVPAVAGAADGALDPGFAGDGKAQTSVANGFDAANAVAVDSQSRVIAVGTARIDADTDFAIVRYLSDGTPDPSFSGDGIQIIDFTGGDDSAAGVAIDSSGGIIVAGTTNDNTASSDFGLVRLTPSGEQDMTFGTSGFTQTTVNGKDRAAGVAIDPQGRIVIGGFALVGGDFDYAAARYDGAGHPDNSFSADGKNTADFTPLGGDDDVSSSIAVDDQGRAVLAGATSINGGQFGLARFTATGAHDPNFDGDGLVSTTLADGDSNARGVAIDAQGRIVAGGSAKDGAFPSAAALARYTPGGDLDPSFGSSGKAVVPFTTYTALNDIAVDPQGRLVGVGHANSSASGCAENALAMRLTDAGSIDPTFAAGGIFLTNDTAFPCEEPAGVALDPQDRIVMTGSGLSGLHNTDFWAARLIGDSVAPTASIDSGPKDGARIRDTKPAFAVSSDDARATLTCDFDGASAACGSPAKPAAKLKNGKHTFSVTATDPAGNASAPATRSFTVDTKKPKVKIKGDTSVGADAKVKLKLKVSEPAKLKCKLDKAKARKCGKKFKARLDAGTHKLKVTATDRAGNKGKAKAKLSAGN